jgi:hypothetical protein
MIIDADAATNWEIATWFNYDLEDPTSLRAFRADWDGLTATERIDLRQEVGRLLSGGDAE